MSQPFFGRASEMQGAPERAGNELDRLLEERFGFTGFREGQREVIQWLLSGASCLVLMPTGQGKSLCYQLPALVLPGLTLVISPLIALMKDQADAMRRRGIAATAINSSLSASERQNAYRALANGEIKIALVSPERFRNQDFRQALAGQDIALLAVDEAHCVSQWGHDFRPDYTEIASFRALLGNPRTIALTATATPRVQSDIIKQCGFAPEQMRVFHQGVARPNLFLGVQEVIDEGEKFETLHRKLRATSGAAIVYFSLIRGLDRFAAYLDLQGFPYMVYHGQLSTGARRQAQNTFLKSKKAIMLATNAFGLGVDKPDIRAILHAEVPDSLEAYYQEIGRAGRDGKESRCLLFYDQADLAVQMEFLKWKNPDADFLKRTFETLAAAGDTLPSLRYEEIQERIVHKNRGDHRLETALSLLERYGVTAGSPEQGTLRVLGDVPDTLVDPQRIAAKREEDQKRLVAMVEYVRETGCRRMNVHRYFGFETSPCGHCDLCCA